MNRLLTSVAFSLVLGAGTVAPVVAQKPPTSVHVGVLPNDDMVSCLYAQQSGMFRKAGLDVTIDHSAANGSAIAAAVSSGALDIGKSSATVLIDAHSHGLPFTLIGTAALYESKAPYVGFIVPKDSPVKAAKDLTSGTIGLSSVRDSAQLALMKSIEDSGGSTKSLQFTEIPMSAAPPAVEQNRVQASEISYPPLQAALDTGKFRFIPAFNAFGSSYIFSVWFTTTDYATKHPEIVKTFARVLAESARYTNKHHTETAPMLAKFSGIPLATIERMPRVTNGTGIYPSGLQPLIDAEAKYGFIPRAFAASELIWPDVESKGP